MLSPMTLLTSRHQTKILIALAILASIVTGLYFWPASKTGINTDAAVQILYDSGVTQPLPASIPLDKKKVALGSKLFHDARLSADDTISCASCHNLSGGGMDNRPLSLGIKGGMTSVNTPTVFNSGFNFVQFWDGRAPTLEVQIDGPVNHPNEMGSNWPQIVSKLKQDPIYIEQFQQLYPDGITEINIKKSIATFERSLITPNSRFDKYLAGDKSALNALEQSGYQLFQSYGCVSCHQGINLGGNMYEKMGLMGNYFADRGNLTTADRGRFNRTGKAEHLYEFRVPSLRNVALTAPYFHDGSAKTLESAISVMAKYQLGRPMPESNVNAIAAFLRSTTGEYQGKPF